MIAPRALGQRLALPLLMLALIAWAVSVVDAFVARRYLYGDASYFLLSAISEGRVAAWCGGCWEPGRIYTGRMGCSAAYELPTLLASLVAPGRLPFLERIYGATLLFHVPLGLVLTWLVVRRRWLLIFPVASLFLGVLNTSLYAVGCSILLHSLFWVLLLRLLEPVPIAGWEWALLCLVALPTPLAYETMAPYGILLLIACVRRLARSASGIERTGVWALAVWFALGVAFAGLSVLAPFDPSNRGSFFQSFLSLLSLSLANPGIPGSLLALFGVVVVFVRPTVPAWVRGFLVVAISSGALYQGLSIAVWPEATNFHGQIQGRVLLAIIPVVLGAFALHFTREGRAPSTETVRWVALFVALVGLGQVAWHLQATRLWSGMLDTLRSNLEAHRGPVPFPASVAAQPAVGRQPVLLLHAQWPLPALSLLLARDGVVRSALVFRTGTFYPLDLEDTAVLHRLETCGLDFEPYREALARADILSGERILDFGIAGEAWKYEWGDWGSPQRGGTWARGADFSLRFALSGEGPAPTLLRARVGADVGPERENLRTRIAVNGVDVGTWEFSADSADELPRIRALPLPPGLMKVSGRNTIAFRVEEPFRSRLGPQTLLFVRLSLRHDGIPHGSEQGAAARGKDPLLVPPTD